MDAAGSATKLEPRDEKVDHVRGEPDAAVILEYADYECPFSRQAFRGIERGTPTISIDGVLYEGGYEPGAFMEALSQ